MASLIAMEGAELGAEALPEVEEGAAEALESRAVPKMEQTEMGRTNAGGTVNANHVTTISYLGYSTKVN